MTQNPADTVTNLAEGLTETLALELLRMTKPSSAPLVGSHFHPPAKVLLAALRAGQTLRLQREPQNPYDSNAILVLLNMDDVLPDFSIDPTELESYGIDPILVNNPPAGQIFILGHIAAKTGEAGLIAPLMDAGAMPMATLSFDMKGAPKVLLQWPG